MASEARAEVAPLSGIVVVVGSINVDLVVQASRLPGPGETVTEGRFGRHGGGKGANQAVAAARAGADVRLIGAVGDDEMGSASLQELRAEGIDVRGVRVVPGIATGVAVIVVDAAGENQIAVASGANHELRAADIAPGLGLRDLSPGWVCLLDLEVPDGPLLAAAEAATRGGATLLINPAPARELPAVLLDAAPILTPNIREAAALGASADPARAGATLHARTGRPVLVTLGPDGVLLVDELGARRAPGFPVDAVDATGAGDAFNGVLAACLAQGRSLDEAVPRAQAAAALSVTVAGARAGMPTSSRIDSFLAARRQLPAGSTSG